MVRCQAMGLLVLAACGRLHFDPVEETTGAARCEVPGFPDPPWLHVERPQALAAGDVDGDGHADVIVGVGVPTDALAIWFGRGDGTFEPGSATPVAGPIVDVALVDLRDTQGLDVVVTTMGGATTFALTTERQLAVLADLSVDGAIYDGLAVRDFNADGVEDVALLRSVQGAVAVMLGARDGTLAVPAMHAVTAFSRDLVSDDFDGDGRFDLAVTTPANAVSVLRSTGNGFATGVDYPTGGSTSVGSLGAGDLTGDGRPELVVGMSGELSILRNRGDGTFDPAISYPGGFATNGIAIVDLTRDGVGDVVALNGSTIVRDAGISVHLVNGDGSLGTPVSYSQPQSPFGLSMADFDEDGLSDFATIGTRSIQLMFGKLGGLRAPPTIPVAMGTSYLRIADIDGDALLDLVTANYEAQSVTVLAGDGRGNVRSRSDSPVGIRLLDLALGDLDNDGLLDAIAAGVTSPVVVLRNAGNGGFGTAMSYGTGFSYSVAVADLNADGRLDVIAAVGANLATFPGNGDGTLGPQQDLVLAATANDVVAGDLDRDGAIDLVTTTDSGTSVFLNNGNGTFAAERREAMNPMLTEYELSLADIDGDTILDLVSSGEITMSTRRGRGDGTFESPIVMRAGSTSIDHDVSDLDGDGFLDVVVAGDFEATASWLRGRGDGTFDPPLAYAAGNGPQTVAAADWDGDGELEVLVTSGDGITVLRRTCIRESPP